jgi:hypothetical protein
LLESSKYWEELVPEEELLKSELKFLMKTTVPLLEMLKAQSVKEIS